MVFIRNSPAKQGKANPTVVNELVRKKLAT